MTTHPSMPHPVITEVRCAGALPPGGHYAQAVLHGNTLHVSGQLGVAAEAPDADTVPLAEQVAVALGHVEAIARVVGAGRGDVVRCTVFIPDVAHWAEVDRAYAAFFGAHRPARAVVPCGPLHHGAQVEIEAVVAVGG